ncbi:unnamed protein product, partial [marine sediment metagenome]
EVVDELSIVRGTMTKPTYTDPLTGQTIGGTPTTTRSDVTPGLINSNTFFSKAGDVWKSAFTTVGLTSPLETSGDIELPIGGQTGKSAYAKFDKGVQDIKSDFWGTGGIFNPFARYKAFAESYKLRQETRAKADELKNVLIRSQYDFIPSLQTQKQKLTQAGYSPFDIKIEKDGDTKTLTMNEIDFASVPTARAKHFVDKGEKGKAYFSLGLAGVTEIAEIGLQGQALKLIGLTGGFATEGGLFGRSIMYGATKYPKVGRVLEYG